mmetsp:Transcript_36700/g.96916  ORF Transcript_36700/g.96916 Transcript_36700/m.96916 type:complete len:163 (+) Transcript_36700:9101-9589(+)
MLSAFDDGGLCQQLGGGVPVVRTARVPTARRSRRQLVTAQTQLSATSPPDVSHIQVGRTSSLAQASALQATVDVSCIPAPVRMASSPGDGRGCDIDGGNGQRRPAAGVGDSVGGVLPGQWAGPMVATASLEMAGGGGLPARAMQTMSEFVSDPSSQSAALGW